VASRARWAADRPVAESLALPIRLVVSTVVIDLGMDAAVRSAMCAAAAHPMT
jgi:hypothetical protein